MSEIRKIIGEDEKLSSIDAKLNDGKFTELRREAEKFEGLIKDPVLRETFDKCFFNTIDTTTFFEEDGTVFVITGDIPAMWLRDSSAQVMQYLFFADRCADVRDYIKGLLKKQFRFITVDPYANAFNRTANGHGHVTDLAKQSPRVWERKFELDSLCYPLFLLIKYYAATGDRECFTEDFFKAFDYIADTFRTEQRHLRESTYYHFIVGAAPNRSAGRGGPYKECGLVWSGYRPSDDKCEYGFYIPGNMFIVSVMEKLAPIFLSCGDEKRAEVCLSLAKKVQSSLQEFAVTEFEGKKIYALETDGLGHYNIMDDANIPNLLSMPYYEYPYIDKEIYKNTRDYILSSKNPYYYEGKCITGVGSPHTPKNYVWPLSVIIRALTSDDKKEVKECVDMLVSSTGGTGYMHEGILKDDDSVYTRPWFAWANSLFAYLILEKQNLIL